MEMPIAANWFELRRLSDGVTHLWEPHVADWLRCNIWHVRGRDRDLIIDAGMGLRSLKAEIARLSERPQTAIGTHSHFDHMGGAHEFEERLGHRSEADIYAHPTCENTAVGGFVRAETFSALPFEGFAPENYEVTPAPLTGYLDEGDVVDLGDRVFNVFHLPGHSPGSIALFEAATGILFSGDVIYDGALYDNVYHSDPDTYRLSLQRLRELPVRTLHGGHYGSFGVQRMRTIIDEYLAGGRRVGNDEDWIAAQIEGGEAVDRNIL